MCGSFDGLLALSGSLKFLSSKPGGGRPFKFEGYVGEGCSGVGKGGGHPFQTLGGPAPPLS